MGLLLGFQRLKPIATNGLQCKQKNTTNNSTSFPKTEALIAPFLPEISNNACMYFSMECKENKAHGSRVWKPVKRGGPFAPCCLSHYVGRGSCFDEPPSLHESTHPGGVGCYTRAKKKLEKKKLKKTPHSICSVCKTGRQTTSFRQDITHHHYKCVDFNFRLFQEGP